jgi:hypothetical protein
MVAAFEQRYGVVDKLHVPLFFHKKRGHKSTKYFMGMTAEVGEYHYSGGKKRISICRHPSYPYRQ